MLYDVADLGELKTFENVHSTAYRRLRSRKSYYVRIEYEGEETYVAKIQNFVKVTSVSEQGGEERVLRLALCDLYTAQELLGWFGSVLHVLAGANPSKVGYPAALSHISHKVALCDATVGNPLYRSNFKRFVTYHNTYSKVDP